MRGTCTHLVLRLLESTINIIFWLPHAWYTSLVIAEAFLEVISQFAEERWICGLLVDLRAQGEPGTLAKGTQ